MVGLTDVAHCDTCGDCVTAEDCCVAGGSPDNITIIVRGFPNQFCTFGIDACQYNCQDMHGTYVLQKVVGTNCTYSCTENAPGISLNPVCDVLPLYDLNGDHPPLFSHCPRSFWGLAISVEFYSVSGVTSVKVTFQLDILTVVITLFEANVDFNDTCCNAAGVIFELATDITIPANPCCIFGASSEVEISAVSCPPAGQSPFSTPQREARIVPIIDKPEDLPKEIEEWLTRPKN